MNFFDEIDELEDEFYISMQSAISMSRLGVDVDEACEVPMSILNKVAGFISKTNDIAVQDIILLKLIDMTNELDAKLDQI